MRPFLSTLLLSTLAFAQSPYEFKNNYPTPAAAQAANTDAAFQRAISAYRFWYPAVSCEGIFAGGRAAGVQDNKNILIMACSPRQVAFTPNSDTPYGAGAINLTDGPMVIDVPPGAFIGLANDHYQGWILDMGIPGPAGPKGAKHLLLPPGYKGEIPQGYFVGHSPSNMVLIAVRSLPQNGDINAALAALREIKIYPLANPTNIATFIDVSDRDLDSTCLKWEDNLKFWEKLHAIINSEPIVEKFLPMYGELGAIGIEKGKPFAADARMKELLTRAAQAGRDQLLVSAFASTRPDRLAWPDRTWEWVGLVPGSAQFETPSGLDLEARDRWFAQAIVTSPAMFRRTPGAGSLYWLAARDKTGAYLDGAKTYKLTVPQPVPNKLFWSVTAYDAQTRSEVQTDQKKAALRSLFELKDIPANQPAELFFGPVAPVGKEKQWIKTTPNRGWFAYFRIYGPTDPAFNGTWKPDDFEEVK